MNSVRPFIWLVASALAISTSIAGAEVIFEENFDEQPDYVSRDYTTNRNHQLHASMGDRLPIGWDSIADWSIYSEPHLEIRAGNEDKARGGTGKSLVMRRGSRSPTWSGDAQLAKNFDQDYKELYVKFWIRFQPEWTHSGSDKLFRIGSYAPDDLTGSSYNSSIGMGFLWDLIHYSTDASGLRNFISTVPSIGGMTMSSPRPSILERSWKFNDQGWNADFTAPTYDLIDQVTGEPLPNSGSTSHAQVFGNVWHKIEFYVKMNSAPGVQDGIFTQWMDDTVLIDNRTVPWLQGGDRNVDRGFNSVKFGGNDFFKSYPNEDEVQEWYAFDDIVIRSSLPLERRGANPESPTDVQIE